MAYTYYIISYAEGKKCLWRYNNKSKKDYWHVTLRNAITFVACLFNVRCFIRVIHFAKGFEYKKIWQGLEYSDCIPLQRRKIFSHPKECPGMTLNCICWWGFSSGDLRSTTSLPFLQDPLSLRWDPNRYYNSESNRYVGKSLVFHGEVSKKWL